LTSRYTGRSTTSIAPTSRRGSRPAPSSAPARFWPEAASRCRASRSSPRAPAVRVGVASDLHGRLDPLLPRVLRGVECILLAGDTVDESLLDRLRAIAPLHAVRGNNDRSPGLLALPEFLDLELGGVKILLAHDRKDRRLPAAIARSRPHVLVVGHSHQPLLARDSGMLIVNP